MANNWAIAIGINQYLFFQPLGCAQADAEAFRDFLVAEAGFLRKQSLLMTDSSPPIGDRYTYPTKENILLLFEDLAAACWQPQDQLWLFFSGYGVNHKGKDYLMPVEGHPDRVEETGIEVQALMQSLCVADLDVLLLLDFNRASASLANAVVGQQTIELAQELQIPTIVSCQPGQFSHESRELGHGFFTAALLEALRSDHGSSLEDLQSYLSLRTPELCQHYWRPTQNPVTVIPFSIQETPDLSEITNNTQSVPIFIPEEIFATTRTAPKLDYSNLETDSGEWKKATKEAIPPTPHPTSSKAKKFPDKRAAKTSFWQQLLLWVSSCSMLLVGVIAAVVFRNQTGFRVQEILPASNTETRQTKVVKAVPNVPSPPQPPPLEPDSQTQIPSTSESEQRNQALLDLAKMSLKQTQASDLKKAIATARKIQPGEPLYQQAQENIKIWSSMILDLAEGRASERQYPQAIAAAVLIGKEQPLYPKAQAAINQWRKQAKQYVSNTTVLEAAGGLIQPGQASTYNRAIEVALKVTPGEPGSEMAKKSIDNWSERILTMAKRRAARGDIKTAIATAVLVPENTAAHEEAQKAIEKWQLNLKN